MAFVSNRSGRDAIWLAKPGAAPTRLLDGEGGLLRSLSFSPDGSRLTVTHVSPQHVRVRVLTVEGSDITSFEVKNIGVGAPTWTPDGKALVLFDDAADCYLRVEVADTRHRTKLPNCEWDGIVYRPNGVFGARVDKPGVWRLDGAAPRLLNAKYPPRYDALLTFRGDDILIPEFGAGITPKILAQPVAGGPDRVLGYAPGASYQSALGATPIAVNPQTQEVFYTAEIGRDPNIDLLTLVRR